MENNEPQKDDLVNRQDSKALVLLDTEKIEKAITNAVKPLVELWIEKSNETEQLRIRQTSETENKNLDLQKENLNAAKAQFNIFAVVFIITVALSIILEFIGKFTMTTGIIVTAVLTLSGSHIAATKKNIKQ
ncbi:MAG: hypothetical protein K1X81_09285 [Bacteroidia bacterium]|nr:hypothetical protein [Bacteroidia bacterium]